MASTTRQVIGLLAAAALVLTGCGRTSESTPEAAKSVNTAAATGEINLWAMGEEGKALGDFVKGFETANPGITVKVTPLDWGVAHDKLVTSVAGNVAPDVSMMGTTWMGEFAKMGALDPVPANLIDKSAFFSGAWDTGVVNGTPYGVPWYVETRVLYYRKDQAGKAGVQPPATWKEMRDFVTALHDKGGASQGMSLGIDEGSWQQLLPLFWQSGGKMTGSSGKWTLDTPEMVKALTEYQWYFNQKLAPNKVDTGAFPASFYSGKVGAYYSGPWMMSVMDKDGGASFKDKYGVAPLPKGDVSGTSFIGGGNAVVFKNTKNRDAAWKLVQWLVDPATQAKWYQTVSALPSVQAAWSDPALTADPRLAVFGEQLKDAQAPPPFPTWDQVGTMMGAEIQKLALGKVSPAQAAKDMQAQADAIGVGA
jgi:multiple sugar transport system substrate-binding protein